MNKKVLLLLLGAATSVAVQARHLSPDEAYARAFSQIQDDPNGQIKMAPSLSQSPKLIYSAAIDNRPMAYVFAGNSDNGFTVVSADDVAQPILGYSDNSTFDPANIPSNLKAWLDGYAREIAYASDNAFAPAKAAERTEFAEVDPMLTTTWNQDAPYWNDCPMLNGQRCYTGCVATAMAQVMNYHKWPEQGQGSISYSWNYNNNQRLSCNFAEMTFEWDKMLDSYNANSPAENCKAVAQLMKACGYASKMQYTPYASGTTGYSAAEGMVQYFNYDKSLCIQNREWYTTQEWEELVYTEMTTNGPVYYDGTGTDGGHAFVCDGYRGNGYFHFNWGWGGLSDGYFLLNALNPGSQGAGGNTSGFNYQQSIMQNLTKPQDNSILTAIMAAAGGFTTDVTTTTTGSSVLFKTAVTGSGYGFFSMSISTISNMSIGIKYVNNETGATEYITSGYYSSFTISPLTGFSQFSVTLPRSLSNGTYTVTPAFRVGSGEIQDMKTEGSYNNALTMTVNGTSVTFAEVGAEASIAATNITVINDITPTGTFVIRMALTNTGSCEFNGSIEARFLNAKGTVIAYGAERTLLLQVGESMTAQYQSEIVRGSLQEGTYSLRFYSPTTRKYLNDPVEVKVIEPLVFDCSRLRVASTSNVNCNNVEVSANVDCTSGKYNGPLAFIASSSNEVLTPVGMFLSDNMSFTAGDSKAVSFTGVFEEGEVGRIYYAALAYRDADGIYKQIGSSMYRFRVGTASGIDDILTDQTLTAPVIYPNPAESMATLAAPVEIKSIEAYSLNGAAMRISAEIDGSRAQLDVTSLPAGTYIVIAVGTNGTRMPAKLIKR